MGIKAIYYRWHTHEIKGFEMNERTKISYYTITDFIFLRLKDTQHSRSVYRIQ